LEPYQSTLIKRIGIFISICTFGLLAPLLISFRQDESDSDYFHDNLRKNYGMTVNETEEEAKRDLLPKTTKR
jgi:hypothetical protein